MIRVSALTGTKWMNWAMVGACVGGFLLMLPVAEKRHRLAVDLDLNSPDGCHADGAVISTTNG
jgi:hypothetical protein